MLKIYFMESNKVGDWGGGGYGKWAKSEKHCNYLWTLKTPKVFAKLVGPNFDGFGSLHLSFGIHRRFGMYLVSI